MKNLSKVLFSALAVFCLALPLAAQRKASTAKKHKKELYSVVLVDKDMKIYTKSGVKDLKKSLDADYKKAVADYNKSKKEARKAKVKFTEPKPKKAKFKVVKSGFKSQQDAEKYIAKIRAKEKKKADAKRHKRPDKTEKKPHKNPDESGKTHHLVHAS